MSATFIFIIVFANSVAISLRLSPSHLEENIIAQIYFSSGLVNALVVTISSSFSSLDWESGKVVWKIIRGYVFVNVIFTLIVGGVSATGLGLGGFIGSFVGLLLGMGAGVAARFFLFTKYYDTLSKLDKRRIYVGFWLRCLLGNLFAIPLSWHIANIFIKVDPKFFKYLKLPTTEQLFFSVVAVLVAGAAFVYVSLLPLLEHRRQLAAYRTQEQKLIKP